MTDETPKTPEIHESKEPKKPAFGAQLIAAREAKGLDRKDVSSQLRLSEKIIYMLEKDRYPKDLPATFIRGYIRAYAKFLQIPDTETNKALELVKHEPPATNVVPLSSRNLDTISRDYYFMNIFSYLIAITLLGLVGTWAYTHYSLNNKIMIESVLNTPQNAPIKVNPKPMVATTTPAPQPLTPQPPVIQAPVVQPTVTPAPEKTVATVVKENENKVEKPTVIEKPKKVAQAAETSEEDDGYTDEPDLASND